MPASDTEQPANAVLHGAEASRAGIAALKKRKENQPKIGDSKDETIEIKNSREIAGQDLDMVCR